MTSKKKNKCIDNKKKENGKHLLHDKSFLTLSTSDSKDTKDLLISSQSILLLSSYDKISETLRDVDCNSKKENKLTLKPTTDTLDVDENSNSNKTIVSTCDFNDSLDLNLYKNIDNRDSYLLNNKSLNLNDKLIKEDSDYVYNNNSCKINSNVTANEVENGISKKDKDKKNWYSKFKSHLLFEKKNKNSVKICNLNYKLSELNSKFDEINNENLKSDINKQSEGNNNKMNVTVNNNEIVSNYINNSGTNNECENNADEYFENNKNCTNSINYLVDKEISKYLLSKFKFFLKNYKIYNDKTHSLGKDGDNITSDNVKKTQLPKSKVVRNRSSRVDISNNKNVEINKYITKNESLNQTNTNIDNQDKESIIFDDEYIKITGVNMVAPFLEPQRKEYYGKKTLVLDLDETLIHSSFQPIRNPSFIINIEIEGEYHDVYVLKRPGVDKFLDVVTSLFEVVIFTASLSKYANPLLNRLDPLFKCPYRLFRENCTVDGNSYIKDLSKLGRPLKDIIIIDNSPISYILQPENAIPITSWFNDENDKQLYELIPLLEFIAERHPTISTSFGSLSDFGFDVYTKEQKELIEFNTNNVYSDNKCLDQEITTSFSIICLNGMDDTYNCNNNNNEKNKKNSIYVESSFYNKMT
ncbi:hypothetical protein FG379_002211 [Cryptosporidium bovis]|uniref:uncharacterized protein n=1 Tax=Cryptosporidium bovis TaxID=310047 RepID=UPI00351A5F21|nr:hypothetical protein FG379_002211 [Cryptosporidium bovis]